MNDKLDNDLLLAVIEKSNEVYLSYILLNLVNNKEFTIEGNKRSLADYCTTLTDGNNHKITLNDRTEYHIKLEKIAENKYEFSIKGNDNDTDCNVKSLVEYTESDLLNLCKGRKLILEKSHDDEYRFSTNLKGENVRIGGSDKIDLHAFHIANLYEIILELQSKQKFNILVAMSTGSGKSFTQAILFLVAYLADQECVFAVPTDQLADQLYKDFTRLLPDDITNKIALSSLLTNSKFSITTHKSLLLDQWTNVYNKSQKPPFYFIDEFDKIDRELLDKRLDILITQFPTMLLSATPKERITKNYKKIIYLSPQKKEELKIAKKPLTEALKAKSIMIKSRKQAIMCFIILYFSAILINRPVNYCANHILKLLKISSPLLSFLLLLLIYSIIFAIVAFPFYKFINDPIINFIFKESYAKNSPIHSIFLREKNKMFKESFENLEKPKLEILKNPDSNIIIMDDFLSPIEVEEILEALKKPNNEVKIINIDDPFYRMQNSIFSTVSSLLLNRNTVSAAHEYIRASEESLSLLSSKPNKDYPIKSFLRWNIHSAIGENALILARENNIIINLNAIFNSGYGSEYIYNNKDRTKFVFRDALYDLHLLGGMCLVDCSYKENQRSRRLFNMSKLIKNAYPNISNQELYKNINRIDFSDTKSYLMYRVLHGLINLTIGFLTEKDIITLNKNRRDSLSNLVELVKKRLDDDDIRNKLTDYLETNKNFSKQLIEKTITPIKSLLEILKKNKNNPDILEMIVDNWPLDRKLHNIFIEPQDKYQEHYDKFMGVIDHTESDYQDDDIFTIRRFCREHKIIFTGLGKNDFGIEENRPFYNAVGAVTRRKEGVNYCNDYNLSDITTLFKESLINVVDRGNLGRGINSPAIQHVAIITESKSNLLNDPINIVQAYGRNRGLDETKQPFFFISSKEDIIFDVNLMNKTTFFKSMFEKSRKHHNLLLKDSYKALASEIIDCVFNLNEEKNATNRKILIKDKIISCFRRLYSKNNYDIVKTRKEFNSIIRLVNTKISHHKEDIRNRQQFNLLQKVAFYIFKKCVKFVLHTKWSINHMIFTIKARKLTKNDDNALAYSFILNNYDHEGCVKAFTITNYINEIIQDEINRSGNLNLNEKIINLYLKNNSHNKVFYKIIEPLLQNEEILLNMLKVLEIRDIDVKTIKDFFIDIKTLDASAIITKYCQGEKYEETLVKRILDCVVSINHQIMCCQDHYYNNTAHVKSVEEFKLKNEHSIFNYKVSYRPGLICYNIIYFLTLMFLVALSIPELHLINNPTFVIKVLLSVALTSLMTLYQLLMECESIITVLLSRNNSSLYPVEINEIYLTYHKEPIEYLETKVPHIVEKLSHNILQKEPLTDTEVRSGNKLDHLEELEPLKELQLAI